MHSTIRQTIFQAEPLKNIVGVGDTTAYHVVATPGPALGTLGIVTVPAHAEILNDPVFTRNSANESGGSQAAARSASQAAYWLRRALATLKF